MQQALFIFITLFLVAKETRVRCRNFVNCNGVSSGKSEDFSATYEVYICIMKLNNEMKI